MWLLPLVLIVLCGQINCQESEGNKNLGESNFKDAVFTYPPGILSERDIPVCSQGSDELIACNIVNKRYFYPPTIERLCRCPDRSECPWQFSEYKVAHRKEGVVKRLMDVNSLMLSTRAQMKFCNEITALEKCTKSQNETALQVITMEPDVANVRRIIAHCHCPAFKRWVMLSDESKEFVNGTVQRILSYGCGKLPRCGTDELCGHVRQDNYSTFFLCSCPVKHLCYPRDMSEVYNVTELLYSGPAIKSYCVKDRHAQG